MNPIPRKGYHAETWWHTVLTNEYGPRQIVVGLEGWANSQKSAAVVRPPLTETSLAAAAAAVDASRVPLVRIGRCSAAHGNPIEQLGG